MSTAVNLMTERAKFVAAGARIGNAWAAFILTLFVLLAPISGWIWRQSSAIAREREAVDASYEPIRQMTAANRTLTAQAAELVAAEQLPLTLARRQPFVSVLNVVSTAVSATEGAAYVEFIRLDHPASGSAGASLPRLVTLDVSCDETFEISNLTSALAQPPIKDVRVVSNTPDDVGAKRKRCVIECEL